MIEEVNDAVEGAEKYEILLVGPHAFVEVKQWLQLLQLDASGFSQAFRGSLVQEPPIIWLGHFHAPDDSHRSPLGLNLVENKGSFGAPADHFSPRLPLTAALTFHHLGIEEQEQTEWLELVIQNRLCVQSLEQRLFDVALLRLKRKRELNQRHLIHVVDCYEPGLPLADELPQLYDVEDVGRLREHPLVFVHSVDSFKLLDGRVRLAVLGAAVDQKLG